MDSEKSLVVFEGKGVRRLWHDILGYFSCDGCCWGVDQQFCAAALLVWPGNQAQDRRFGWIH